MAQAAGQDDAAMAARLKQHPRHCPEGVRKRKERQFRAFMAQFSGKRTGSACHQRRTRG